MLPCVKGEEMKLSGRLMVEGKPVREAESEDNEDKHDFRDKLETCLVDLCGKLEAPVPLWLKKNTRELAIFRRTFFAREQFIEKVWFDKLEIRLGG